MRLQGFEPWTPWLRVRCSTNWAKDAYLIICLSFFVSFVPQDMLYYTLWFEESQHLFLIFLFFSFLFFISSFDAILFSDFSISDSEFLIWNAWLLTPRFTLLRFRRNELDFLFFKPYLPLSLYTDQAASPADSYIPAWRSLLFIIWKQADLFTDQPDKTTFYINAEYLCAR